MLITIISLFYFNSDIIYFITMPPKKKNQNDVMSAILNQLQIINSEIQSVKSEIHTINEKLDAMENQIKTVDDKVDYIEKDTQANKTNVIELVKDQSNIKVSIGKLERDSLRSSLETFTSRMLLTTVQLELSSWKSHQQDLTRLEDKIRSLQQELNQNNDSIKKTMEPILLHMKTVKPIIDLTDGDIDNSFVFDPGKQRK